MSTGMLRRHREAREKAAAEAAVKPSPAPEAKPENPAPQTPAPVAKPKSKAELKAMMAKDPKFAAAFQEEMKSADAETKEAVEGN